jgi:hypothetical protein
MIGDIDSHLQGQAFPVDLTDADPDQPKKSPILSSRARWLWLCRITQVLRLGQQCIAVTPPSNTRSAHHHTAVPGWLTIKFSRVADAAQELDVDSRKRRGSIVGAGLPPTS